MAEVDTMTDPRRTIEAGQLDGYVHMVFATGSKFQTGCGFKIPWKNITILLQRPEDITCPKCKEIRHGQKV